MGRFVKGEIVVTPFPFSDLSSKIKRPALVVSMLKGNDLILCQVTSINHPKDPYQINLKKENFEKGELKIKSYIKPSIIFTLRDSIILYSIGKISKNKIKEVEKKICEIIKAN